MSRTTKKTRRKAKAAPGSYPQLSDEQLLARYRDEADRRAFEELVHRYERELYSYLHRYLGDASLAEDVFQNTFLQLHLKCGMYETGRPVKPWLYTIATHQAIDALRKSGRHPVLSLDVRPSGEEEHVGTLLDLLESAAPGPLANLTAEERRQWVRRSVDDLPPHLKSVVVLAYYQGLKYREIAEILDIPVGTVKSRLHTAVGKLHEHWQLSQAARDR